MRFDVACVRIIYIHIIIIIIIIMMFDIFLFSHPLEIFIIIIIVPFIAHRGGNGPLRCPDDVYKGVAIFTLYIGSLMFSFLFLSPVANYLGVAVIKDREACFYTYSRTCLGKIFEKNEK